MSKIQKCDGISVVIDIDIDKCYRGFGPSRQKEYEQMTPEKWKGRAESLIEEVKRHVSYHENYSGVSFRYDNLRDVCSHCGYDWELDENGLPACCQKAIDETIAEAAQCSA